MPFRLWAASAGLTFPSALTTGTSGPLTTLTPGTAYHAAGGAGGTLVGGINSGWSVSTAGAWTFAASGPYVVNSLSLAYPVVINNKNNVTVSNSSIIVDGSTPTFTYCIDLSGTTTGTTVTGCTLGGGNGGGSRVEFGVNGGTDTALTITGCNIYWFRVAAGINNGMFAGNYVHDPGYDAADHTDGLSSLGTGGATSFATGLQVLGNTILMQIGQTSPLDMGSTHSTCSWTLISGNFLAGGGYGVYCGASGSSNSQRGISGCTISGGSLTTISYASAATGDIGATITGANVPVNTTITGAVANTSYTISQNGTAGSSLSFTLTSTKGSFRTDTGCSISGGTTVADASVIASDAGATVTGTGVLPNTTIVSLTGTYPSYTGYTLSQAATTGSGLSLTLHYMTNFVVTNNRFSQAYYPKCGAFGTHAFFDSAVASNIWSGNVYHDTNAVILVTDP